MAKEKNSRPREIPMTDLGWSPDGSERDDYPAAEDDSHAAGTPGGGTAAGGLAGTNINDGSPNNADLEDALGSGVRDTAGEDDDAAGHGGAAGGAVGGSPAGKRTAGGNSHDQRAPGQGRKHRG